MVARVCADLGETYEEVDIDADPALRRRYGEEIPVTFVDGRQHDFWRVDETRLRRGARADGPLTATPVGGEHSHMCYAGVRSVCSPVHKLLQ